MLGLMYGLTDQWTIMVMVPYLYNSMKEKYVYRNSELNFGLGDISLSFLYAPVETDLYRVVLNMGVLFPTGSINKVPYLMQLGSGSYAFLPKLSASYYWGKASLGSQLGFKYFMHDNKYRYKEGHEFSAHVWGAYNLNKNISLSLRGAYHNRQAIEGRDFYVQDMMFGMEMSPMDKVPFQDKDSVFSYLGFNLVGTRFLKGHRLAIEFGLPVQQWGRGLQMEEFYVAHLGWQKTF